MSAHTVGRDKATKPLAVLPDCVEPENPVLKYLRQDRLPQPVY